jgi:transcriptional regulator with XRE-family HTH domain
LLRKNIIRFAGGNEAMPERNPKSNVKKNGMSMEARRIFELLDENNLSEYELSRCTGISHVTISDWRNSRKVPCTSSIEKVCRSFGISKAEFYSMGVYATEQDESADKLFIEMKYYCNRIIANGDGEIGLHVLQKLSIK